MEILVEAEIRGLGTSKVAHVHIETLNCCLAIYVHTDTCDLALSTKGLQMHAVVSQTSIELGKEEQVSAGAELGIVRYPVSSLRFDSLDRVTFIRRLPLLGLIRCVRDGRLLTLQ